MPRRKNKDEFFLFEYGALSHDKLTSIIGDVEVVCGAIFPHHQIVFAGSSRMFGGSSVATAVRRDGYNVMGVVYKIQETQLELLDLFMECNLGLRKRTQAVVDDGRGSQEVEMYVLQPQAMSHKARPSVLYSELHMKLAREGYDLYRKPNVAAVS